jgi:hypothetical protein
LTAGTDRGILKKIEKGGQPWPANPKAENAVPQRRPQQRLPRNRQKNKLIIS